MHRALPTEALTPVRVPGPGAPDSEIIRFATTLDGYEEVGGGDAAALGRYLDTLDTDNPEALSLHDLRIVLFARQRAHYHQGGGWPGVPDALMQEMRALTVLIRERVEARGRGVGVWRGDITRLDVDALVNAANRALSGGGGVDGAIHQAAGPKLLEAGLGLPEVTRGVRCPTGEACITPAFDLPARWVIHAVGPVWRGGSENEAELLASAYRSSLALAAERALDVVAFPALSTGAYGYPPEQAARIAVGAVRAFQREHVQPVRVVLVALDGRSEKALRRALGDAADS